MWTSFSQFVIRIVILRGARVDGEQGRHLDGGGEDADLPEPPVSTAEPGVEEADAGVLVFDWFPHRAGRVCKDRTLGGIEGVQAGHLLRMIVRVTAAVVGRL